MHQYQRRWRQHKSSPNSQFFYNRIVWTIAAIALVLIIKFLFFSSPVSTKKIPTTPSVSAEGMIVTPMDDESLSYIIQKDNKRVRIAATGSVMIPTDLYAAVERWGALARLKGHTIDLDNNTQIALSEKPNTDITLIKGDAWVNASGENLRLEAQNLKASIPSGSVAMLESSIAQGIIYAISGDIQVEAANQTGTLHAGQMIAIRNSDINGKINLSEKIRPIDASLSRHPLFLRNNGADILRQEKQEKDAEISGTGSTETEKNSPESGSGEEITENTNTKKYIEFITPIDGSSAKSANITISGKLLSDEVKKVTINEVESEVSPVNETFTLTDFSLHEGVNNIVFKVYDSAGKELERGIIAVTAPKSVTKQKTIIPENFPISAKDFIITAPDSNPHATTESYVKVQGSIPKGVVHHITVNGYRLKKFKPNSGSWYYHANADIGTIKEGTNLYYINFYNSENTLLYTQLFTIIKDSPRPQRSNTTVINEIPLTPVP